MNKDRLQTAALIAAAMIIGGAATYFMLGKRETVVAVPAAPAKVNQQPTSTIAQFTTSHDEELDAALADARAQRAAGTLKPLATTPDEFARALGGLNFRLHDFTTRYDEPPAADDAEFPAYSEELKSLTVTLANLLSDEALMDKITDDNPKLLARHQSRLVAGALALDEATADKVEAIILASYEKSLPADAPDRELTDAEAAELEKKFTALTDEIEQAIRPLLTPEQIARLDSMGRDQVLFGLEQE